MSVPPNIGFRHWITQWDNRSKTEIDKLFPLVMRIGSTARNAGRKVREKTNAANTPIQTIFPRSLKGGASEKFIVRNPIAVVMLVRNTGWKLILRDSTIASLLDFPCRR
jgi:hypothetical protein